MKIKLAYFILYRLLEIESILWAITDIIRGKRMQIVKYISDNTKK